MIKENWFDRHLSIINQALILIIILLNSYVIAMPLLPKVTYQVANIVSKPKSIETVEERKEIDRSFDHLIIPDMHLDEKIWVGNNEKLVNKGVWHIPHSSTPDKGSNTVLVGHRFSYKDPAVFYHMDKLKQDDLITLAWGGKLYTYKVNETKIVKPTDIYIEDASQDPMLTLYTCHPIWSTRERLVVTAKLESVDE